MLPADPSRRTILFVNWAHALDHFVLLIFPTAVIAIAAELHRDYGELIWLSTGAFVAFGLFSLPVGWLADRYGRRTLLIWYFFGYGAACLLVAISPGLATLAGSLLILGIFSAIYHPIGSAMIVANTEELGRDLGINGVWGNVGAATASGITAAIASVLGWRASFAVPGLILIASGFAFMRLAGNAAKSEITKKATHSVALGRRGIFVLLIAFLLAVIASGLTFNITSIALPKVIDERFGMPIPLALTGWITMAVFFCGALTQIVAGKLIDRFPLPQIYIGMSIMQPAGLALAALTTGMPMLLGLIFVMSAIYGQVVLNDAMIARYVPDEYRNKAYSIRYFSTFTIGGFAAPLIAILRAEGGFETVLIAAAMMGSVVFASALVTWSLTRGRLRGSYVPAE